MTDLDHEMKTYVIMADEIWGDFNFDGELYHEDYCLCARGGEA